MNEKMKKDISVLSEETMEEISKWADEYIKDMNEKHKIVSSDDYIKWINDFFSRMNFDRFMDDQWDYNQNAISESDLHNVELLSTFAGYIDEIAANHEIRNMSNYSEGDIKYFIIIDNQYYSIETCHGQGSFTTIEKVDSKEWHNWIKLETKKE